MSVQIVPGSKNACYCLMHTWLEREGRFYCLSFFEENSAWGTIKVAYVVIRIMLQSRNDVGWQVVFLHKRYIHFSSYRMNKHQFSHTFEYSKKQSTVYFFEGFSNTVTKIKQKHEEEDDDQNANTRETVKQTFLRFVLFWATWHKYIPSLENPGWLMNFYRFFSVYF